MAAKARGSSTPERKGSEGPSAKKAATQKRKASRRTMRELNDKAAVKVTNERETERIAQADERTSTARELAFVLTRAEQRDRRRLAEVLHDHLQQLLAAAKLRLGMMRNSVGAQEAQQSLDEIMALLEDSIRASRSLTAELNPPILYESGLAAALEWLGRQMASNYGLTVRVEADAGVELDDEDVRVLLFQCVRELLFNVVKHAGAGTATVRMDAENGRRVRIEVTDEGRGFDPSELSSYKGADHFGLLNVRQRLELLGGRFELESAPGQGTRASLSALLRSEKGPTPASAQSRHAVREAVRAAAALAHEDSGSGKIRVLLADDHQMMREGLAALLRRESDVELVGEAFDGKEAVELARRFRPDVVVMDVTMPHVSGIEATRRIVAELPDVSVIGLSMHEEADMAAAMRAAGASSYLTKDSPPEVLMAAIRACCRHREKAGKSGKGEA